MRRFSLSLSLLLILLVALPPLAVLAQEDEELELVTYTSEDEVLTFSYPVGWVGTINEDGSILMANSESALENLQDPDTPIERVGELGISLVFMPLEMLTMMGIEADANTDPEAMLQGFIAMLTAGGTEGVPMFGEAMFLEVDEETTIPAATLTFEENELEGLFLLFPVSDDLYVMGFFNAHTDEREGNEALVAAVAASVEVNFTADELTDVFTANAGEFGEAGEVAVQDADNNEGQPQVEVEAAEGSSASNDVWTVTVESATEESSVEDAFMSSYSPRSGYSFVVVELNVSNLALDESVNLPDGDQLISGVQLYGNGSKPAPWAFGVGNILLRDSEGNDYEPEGFGVGSTLLIDSSISGFSVGSPHEEDTFTIVFAVENSSLGDPFQLLFEGLPAITVEVD